MKNTWGSLFSIEEANALITSVKDGFLSICGDNKVLQKLVAGRWVGGSIPYFMGKNDHNSETIGVVSQDKVLITKLPNFENLGLKTTCKVYDKEGLKNIAKDAPVNGYSFVVIPGFSDVHVEYGQNAPRYEDMFLKPIFGWIAGIHLSNLGSEKPKVYSGFSNQGFEDRAVVVHVELPANKTATIDILNIFDTSDMPEIFFLDNGFVAKDCVINGVQTNFAQWCVSNNIDGKLPLMADYCGAKINVCIQSVDAEKGVVNFYAPLFKGVGYRFAKPVGNYSQNFSTAMQSLPENAPFACNCILNFLYGELEGKTAGMPGPVTFGEIAYQLLNQTMVYVEIQDL